MLRTVIFDMDGVLVETEPIHFLAYQLHFKELGIEVSADLYKTFIGSSTKNIYKRIKEHFSLTQSVEELIQRKRELYSEAFDKAVNLKMLPGSFEFIQELHKNNIQMIVASSSANETINTIFNRFGLDKYFSHKVSGEDFPESKPNPAIFNHAQYLSGCKKEECIVIEDSTNGIKAANAAQIFVVGLHSEGSDQNYENADLEISSFKELTIDRINKLLS